MAGRAAERMLMEGESVKPVDDLRQARELAMLICTSEEALETFIARCMLRRAICCCLATVHDGHVQPPRLCEPCRSEMILSIPARQVANAITTWSDHHRTSFSHPFALSRGSG